MVFAPPEVITGRLMSGAGAAPMTAAAGSFTAAAAAYEAAADRLLAHLMTLQGAWQSPTMETLAAAVARFIGWLRVTQVQLTTAAARTADQALAFTTAYATMAQMPEIIDNRVTTGVLHATNFLGMNTIPIGVREGQYLAMTLQDVMVQETYLATSIANTTFEPFVTPTPIAVAPPVVPPLIDQATMGAARAGDTLMLAAAKLESSAHMLQQALGQGVALGVMSGINARTGAEQADARDALDRYRDGQSQQDTANQMGNQLIQQIPQQIAQGASQAGQIPQQLQQVTQPLQQGMQQMTQQFSSQMSNLMNQVKPELRLDNPGFFDTQPSSPTLDRLAGGMGMPALTAALRVPSFSGLSSASTGFRFPSGWDDVVPAAPPASTPGSPVAGGRPMGMGPLNALRRRGEDDEEKVKRPTPELIPVWGAAPEEQDTVSPGQLVGELQDTNARTI
ncbi:PPE family protein [Mycolicibacterium senegalense]|uniref:PPE family protein n=1 Tax=Mycobacteriaceae TaxID=1762 RepID=UPI003AAEBD95